MLHVVMATRGRPHLLARTLESLAACDQPTSYAGTLVVENGDQQGAERVVRDAPAGLRASYLFHPDGNKSASLNVALGSIGARLIVFLDDDVIVGKTLLTAFAAASEGIEGGLFFGGPVFPDYEVAPPPWLVEFLPYSARGWTLDDESAPVTKPSFLGANWAAFHADINRVGGFDPSLGPGAATGSIGQERAMQQRLLDAGCVGRYVPDAKVCHWVPRERCSPRWAFHRMYRDGVSRGLNDEGAEAARVLGYPRWAVRVAARHALRAMVSLARPRSKASLDATREFLLSVGYLKGSRFAHRAGRDRTAAAGH